MTVLAVPSALAGARAFSGLALPTLVLLAWDQRRARRSDDGSKQGRSRSTSPRRSRRHRRLVRAAASDPARLREYDLRGADLSGLYLSGADLEELDLSHARLRGAVLSETRLSGSLLDFTDLSDTDLSHASLAEASLLETDFAGADLRGADLRGARQMVMANVRRAIYDSATRWPAGFDPVHHGAERVSS